MLTTLQHRIPKLEKEKEKNEKAKYISGSKNQAIHKHMIAAS
jgi:hypothetical protein